MKYLATLLLILGFGLSGFGQTIKSLGYNTTNGVVVYSGTNILTFTNNVNLNTGTVGDASQGSIVTMAVGLYDVANDEWAMTFNDSEPQFNGTNRRDNFRANLGFSTDLNTFWTATNASNARSAVGLGTTSSVTFGNLYITNPVGDSFIGRFEGTGGNVLEFYGTDENLAAGYGSAESAIGVGGYGFAVKFSPSVSDWGVPILMQEGDNIVNRPTLSNTITFIQPLDWSQTNFAATTRANLGLGWSALTNTNSATSLLGYTTNGQVVANTGTNALTITNSLNIQQTVTFTNAGVQFRNWTNYASFGYLDYDGSSFYLGVSLENQILIVLRPSGVRLFTSVQFEGTNAEINKATTRTNLGLGGGITTNRTFVSYDGTNYTTNVVTISNGIITGWTQ